MNEQKVMRYELESGPAPGDMISPHIGLLGLLRAYRALRLPDATEAHLPGWSALMEYQALAQVCGADGSLDRDVLAEDPCLKIGFGYRPPRAGQLRNFLVRLGERKSGGDRFLGLLADSVKEATDLWDRKHQSFAEGLPRHVTLDVIELSPRNSGTTVWAKPDEDFPCRIVCLWREAELVLSGGSCDKHSDVINLISCAMSALPKAAFCSLLRAGPVCDHRTILSWLDSQRSNITFLPRTRRYSIHGRRAVDLRYLVGVRLDPAVVNTLKQLDGPWKECSGDAMSGLLWLALPAEELPVAVPNLADVRFVSRCVPAARPEGWQWIYAAFRTNKQGRGHELARWFSRGERRLQRIAQDLTLLASGPHGEDDGPTAEGRFLVALLAYNVFSMLQNVWTLSGAALSLSRFRANFLCASGRITKHENQYGLALHNERLHRRFSMINKIFHVEEKPTIPRKKKT